MKIKNLSITALTFCTILVIVSCNKTDDAGGSLVGTWTFSEFGYDANNNNTVDAGETAPVPASSASNTINFKSDNTYTAVSAAGSGSTSTENGTYIYANGMIISKFGGVSDTVYVNSITSNRMVLKDKSTTPAAWGIFKR